MAIFRWTTSYETGLERVDQQHRGLVDTVNAIGETVNEAHPVDQAEQTALFDRLGKYAAEHFLEEEQLMQREGVDSTFYREHVQQHEYFISEVTRLRQKGESPASVLQFLTHWLAWHILGMDQSMSRQVRRIQRGVSAEQARLREESDDEHVSGATRALLTALRGLFEQVAERNQRLTVLAETLEHRVQERTSELTRTVRNLEREMAASQQLSSQLAEANVHLERLALTDPLTDLYNRRHAMAELKRLTARPEQQPLSVVVVDVDEFKSVNDRYGHEAGDSVLIALSRRLRCCAREQDVVCRMGGDEFLMICPRCDGDEASALAEGLRSNIASRRFAVSSHFWPGSVSVGVATHRQAEETVSALLARADRAAYRAKHGGRNSTAVASVPRRRWWRGKRTVEYRARSGK